MVRGEWCLHFAGKFYLVYTWASILTADLCKAGRYSELVRALPY